LKFALFWRILISRVASWRRSRRIDTLIPAILAEATQPPLKLDDGPSGPDAGQLVQTVLTCLDDSKAEDIVSIDLHGKTSLADAMIIATGRSNVHVGAIAERLIVALKGGRRAPRVEGLQNCDWVLVDAADIIVHIFRPEVRQFYNLEKMWSADRPGERRLG
jgi:ribosome-associated protein